MTQNSPDEVLRAREDSQAAGQEKADDDSLNICITINLVVCIKNNLNPPWPFLIIIRHSDIMHTHSPEPS